MGRAKEKILARNKIKSDKKAAKIEDRERQRIEEARQAAELRQVQESQTETDRDKQKKRKNKYLLREVEVPVPPPKPGRINREHPAVPPNPNHGFVQKPIWKDIQVAREAALLEREREHALQSRITMGHEEELMANAHWTLEHYLRPEEIKIMAEFFLDDAWKNSTLAGIQLSEVTPAVAAVALNRFDLIKRLIKEEQYMSDYYNKWVTPLGCAVITQNWDMIEFILEKDLQAHAVDKFGNTPLIQAALTSGWTSYEMANLWHILKDDERTNVSGANKVGLTFTHALAWRGWYEVLDEVLPLRPKGDDNAQGLWLLVNATMCDGTSPLHFALSQGHAAAAQVLISRGSVIHEEDKAGSTPLCRAIGEMYFSESSAAPEIVQTISPACEVIIQALNDPDCPTDIRNYALRRLQLVMSPSLDEQGFVDAFYRVGRSVFSFLVRFIQDGVDLLLDIRFFYKLISSGKKHMLNPDYVVTIFGILFDVLVYAENISASYSRVCMSFMNEGGADFCLRLMQTMVEAQDLEENSTSRSAASISSGGGAGDWVTGCFGIAAADVNASIQKNVAIAAIMPLIQVIDSPEMMPWFKANFPALRSVYTACQARGGAQMVFACDLDDELVLRTKKKVLVFELMLTKDTWSRPQEVILSYLREAKMDGCPEGEDTEIELDAEAELDGEAEMEEVRPKMSKSARKKKARKERAEAEAEERERLLKGFKTRYFEHMGDL